VRDWGAMWSDSSGLHSSSRIRIHTVRSTPGAEQLIYHHDALRDKIVTRATFGPTSSLLKCTTPTTGYNLAWAAGNNDPSGGTELPSPTGRSQSRGCYRETDFDSLNYRNLFPSLSARDYEPKALRNGGKS